MEAMKNWNIALEELLAHDAWIRALARRLLAGEHDAEDLAQEAWLAATVDPPRPSVPLRAWLVRVARNLRAMRLRSEATRRQHERAAARPETLPSVAEMQEQQEQSGQVARAVFSLEEPYRSAILYRYFQDMPPREIARHLGISAAALETRLRRGLEQLRARLDRDFGDRRAWRQSLAAWIGTGAVKGIASSAANASGSALLSLTGALLMSTKIKIVATAALLAAAGLVTLFLLVRDRPDRGLDAPVPKATTTVEHASTNRAATKPAPGPDPQPVNPDPQDAVATPASVEPKTPNSMILRGRCVAAEDSHPLAGCQVQLEMLDTRDFLFGRVPRSEEDGFEPYTTNAPVAWSTAGLRITLQRGCPVTVRVTDRTTGNPVERFGVRCFPLPGSSLDPDRGRQLRCAGFHASGSLILDSVRRGKNVLLVEPLGGVHAPSTFHEVTVPGPGSTEVVVQVSCLVTRTVRVTQPDGTVVSNTRVQLVRPPLQGTVGLDSRVGRSSLLRSCYPFDEIVLLLDEGATGARGTLAIQGPPDETLALRVLGPGHPPFVVQGVSLEPAADVLEVVVPTGGTLVGKIGPDDVLRRLAPGKNAVARSREKSDPAERAAYLDKHRPGIRLVRHGQNPVAIGQSGHENKILLDSEGRFRVEGIEPGSWDVYFAFSLDNNVDVWSSFHNQLLDTVQDLRAGETRHLEFDLGHLRTGTLTGCVFHRGQPLADHVVSFHGTRIDSRGRTVRVTGRSARTDHQGRFTVELFPGRYRASAAFAQVGKTNGARIQSPEEVEVVAGGRIACDFHLAGARLTIRVLAPDGKTPVTDMRLFVHFLSNRLRIRPAPTDARGEVTLDPVPPGRIELRAFPRGFESTRARRASLREGKRVKTFPAGAIEVPPGETQVTRTIVLPPESGY